MRRIAVGPWWTTVSMLGAWTAAGPAGATLVVQPSLERMATRADVIVHAVVEEQSVTTGEVAGRVLTLTRLKVLMGLKGARTGETLTLYQVGGRQGDRVVRVIGANTFRVGEEIVLFGARFLAQDTVKFLHGARRGGVPWATLHPAGGFIVTYGIGLGKFAIDRSGPVPMAREDLGDVAVLLSTGKGGLVPGPLVRREQPLDIFLDEVRALVSQGGQP
jgi:hypothetical protein